MLRREVAMNGVIRETTICAPSSLIQRRSRPTAQPTARPYNTPPATTRSISKAPPLAVTGSESAVRARPNRVRATTSLTRLSPSRIVTRRRRVPRRCMMEVAATGSVGETAAPSASATGQPSCGTVRCTATMTARAVTQVRPKAITEVGTASSLVSRGAVRKAAR
jgi:hypothetical protein